MLISKENFANIFFVDDTFSCPNGSALHITGLFEDHFKFKSTETNINEISVDYSTLSDAFEAYSINPDANPLSLFHCLASEYKKRLEQAKSDAEVDALWSSAIICV